VSRDNGRVPKDPEWCSTCIEQQTPCLYHVDKDGLPIAYAGPDVYEPTQWVTGVVGKRYKRAFGGIVVCFGYDPRHGFWMRDVEPPHQEHNVSERAIGRTYHTVRLKLGSWNLARIITQLGRMPTIEEAQGHGVGLELAKGTLRDLGALALDNTLTDEGRRVAAIEDFFLSEDA
jgi:hypothetical protein